METFKSLLTSIYMYILGNWLSINLSQLDVKFAESINLILPSLLQTSFIKYLFLKALLLRLTGLKQKAFSSTS